MRQFLKLSDVREFWVSTVGSALASLVSQSLTGVQLFLVTSFSCKYACSYQPYDLLFSRVYYYFYESSRGAILSSSFRSGGKGLSTIESMIAGFIAGSATTIISNPIWVIQTSQAIRTMDSPSSSSPSVTPDPSRPLSRSKAPKKLSMLETIDFIIRKDGIGAFWRGLGPALVLVANPMLQYTVFEQLKNYLVRHRLNQMRTRAAATTRGRALAVIVASAVLSDWDYFLLGAISKLSEC